MKKLLLILTAATMVSVGAFGQGKLAFANDNNHLIYFTTDTTMLAGNTAYAGIGAYTTGGGGTQPISSLAGSPTLVAALYGGTSANSLVLQTTTTIGNYGYEGQVVQANTTFNLATPLPALTPAYFQIEVYDARAASAPGAWATYGEFGGESAIFTAVPQTSLYSAIVQAAAPVSSTWANGTFTLADYPGTKGAIMLYANIPEPGTFALAGLGMATLLIFRRRK